MKHLVLVLISFVCVTFIAAQARACSCIDYDVPRCAAYWQADAVFAGQLLEITPVDKTSDPQVPSVMLHFIVEEPFRGIKGNRVKVETLHGTSCDMKFEKGERYLVYAHKGQRDQLSTGFCTPTTNLRNATDDLSYLRTLTQQGAKETILGRVARNKYEPLSGIKVTVQTAEKTIETKTDDKGNFSVEVGGPGKYTIRTFIPFAAAVMAYNESQQAKVKQTDELTTFEYEIQVEPNQCDYRLIDTFKVDLHATAEISGHVLTAMERPVSRGYVYLVNAADADDRKFAKLEKDGSFKFEGVAVGEYYIVLNPRNEAPREDDPPYQRTYYPDVTDVSAGTRIVVTEGAKLENLTLRVGRPWKERTVTGRVVWQDGRAVPDGHIAVYDGERYVRLVKLDKLGRFNFKIYGDFQYVIMAEKWGPERGGSERLSIAQKATGLTLVLKPID